MSNVLSMPSLKSRLLFMFKLANANGCVVNFFPRLCVRQCVFTQMEKGTCREEDGLYNFNDASFKETTGKLHIMLSSLLTELHKFAHTKENKVMESFITCEQSYVLCHKIGNEPLSKLKYILLLFNNKVDETCITYPMT